MATLQEIQELISSRKFDKAAAALQKIAGKKRQSGVQWQVAMALAANIGDQDTALACARHWSAEAPSDPSRTASLIDALSSTANHEEATSLAKSLQREPSIATDGYFLEGAFLARRGKRDEALQNFRKALSLFPAHGSVWEQIALLNGFEDIDADIAAMKKLTEQIKQPAQLIPLYYALGRAHDYLDQIDTAFEYYSKGAQARQTAMPYDVAPVLRYIERLGQTFSAEFINEHRNPVGGKGLTFIIAAPRSGSTLVEQLLATADGVTPTGEHTLLRLASLSLGSMEPVDMARAKDMKLGDWRRIAQTYENGLRKRFGAAKNYTDKTMINYWYVGLISILFPEAKLVWCERDPRDVVWSCFRSHINANRWAQDLDVCARFIKAHGALCRHWKAVCGDNFTHIRYEDLVSNSDTVTANLFDHADLVRPVDWQEFHKADNAVATASLAQVRKPLNKDAIGSWRRYAKYLDPVYDRHFS